MYKSIECLHGDPNSLKKLVHHYVSSVSTYLALRQAVSTLCHLDDWGKEKSAYFEQVNQVHSHLVVE